MSREQWGRNESGVSETVGFIIIMGIVLTGIGLVTLYGYPALLDSQANANIKNMERNMISLQSDINSLTYKNVPYKETMIQVSGGTLSIKKDPGSTPNFAISIQGEATPRMFYPGEVLFLSQDSTTSISLENGAVHTRYWSSPNGSAMLSEPRWFYDDTTKTFVMSFISMNASENFAQTGIGAVKISLIPPVSTVSIPVTGDVTVQYNANPINNYNIAWRNYLKNSDLNMQYDSGDGFYSSFKLNSDVENLVIKTYNMTVLSL